MKTRIISILTGLGVMLGIPMLGSSVTTSRADQRDRLFNAGWKFIREDVQGAEQEGFNDSQWISVDLPHDFSMMDLPIKLPGSEGSKEPDQIGPFSKSSPGKGNSTGHVLGGTGWYRKTFRLDKTDEGKTVILRFEGIYMESEVWVNGKKAGIHKNGYTPFWFDITSLLNVSGPNAIAVKVVNDGRNSRWYSGSGIYRNVYLTVTEPVHVNTWGVIVKTPKADATQAITDISVTVKNEKQEEATSQVKITIKDPAGSIVTSSTTTATLPANESQVISQQLVVKNPRLWSPESPALYTAEVSLDVNGKISDTYSPSFGIRTLAFSADGFRLNGNTVKLKGGCLHHDNGLLGSAAIDRAEIRKVEIMKANGYNAIRCAHNPPTTTFLDACDRLGMLVIDEFTDMWEHYKNPQDYARFFSEWWKTDLTAMILRDRNHPSIIMWSIGNEVYELEDSTRIRVGSALAGRVRELDDTRAVTQAITDFFFPEGWQSTSPAFALLDVGGYNYGNKYYENDHLNFPNRVMYASESYPVNAFDYWDPVEKFSWVIGDFVWTAMDYIGEVSLGSTSYAPGKGITIQGIPSGFKLPKNMNIFDMQINRPSLWPYYLAWCGDIDITGNRKPQKLYRDVIWDISKMEINVHAPVPEGMGEVISMWGWPDEQPSWNWAGNEGKVLQVRVFTKAPHIRLELNGKVIGEKNLSNEDKYIAVFDVPYEPGKIEAIAIENGQEVARKALKTAGNPVAVRVIAERGTIRADRNDLGYLSVEVVDKDGLVVPDAKIRLNVTATGKGEMVASGNAAPNDMQSVNNTVINTYNGKAQVIVRPYTVTGEISVTAEAEGLKKGDIKVKVVD